MQQGKKFWMNYPNTSGDDPLTSYFRFVRCLVTSTFAFLYCFTGHLGESVPFVGFFVCMSDKTRNLRGVDRAVDK